MDTCLLDVKSLLAESRARCISEAKINYWPRVRKLARLEKNHKLLLKVLLLPFSRISASIRRIPSSSFPLRRTRIKIHNKNERRVPVMLLIKNKNILLLLLIVVQVHTRLISPSPNPQQITIALSRSFVPRA